MRNRYKLWPTGTINHQRYYSRYHSSHQWKLLPSSRFLSHYAHGYDKSTCENVHKFPDNNNHKGTQSTLVACGPLRMDINIAFDSILFMPTACILMFSYWTFKELYFNHYMSTFATEIVFCACRKYVMSWVLLYSALFASYINHTLCGLAL